MSVDTKQYWKSLPAPEKQRIADECGSTVNYIRHIFHGRKPAGWDLSKKIEAATGGVVPRSALRPDIFDESAA